MKKCVRYACDFIIMLFVCCCISCCGMKPSENDGSICDSVDKSNVTYSLPENSISGHIDSVLSLDETIYNPFMRESDSYYSEYKLSMQENDIDYTNYWIQTVIAITKMHRENDFEYARKVIDNEIETFERYGYFPRPEYQNFKYGWVSSMDAPVIAFASQMLYEHTKEEKYKGFVNRLSEYMLMDVSANGYVGNVGIYKWLFEYADSNTNEDSGEFVLNGSLLGTLGTAIIAKSTDNAKLSDLVYLQTCNYKEYADKYLFRHNEWCYYALNDKTIQQPHYAIYEIRIFDALFEVTGDEFFREQAELRRCMLLKYYQGFVEDNKLYFLRAGAPHYYYIDILDTKLVFKDRNGTILDDVTITGTNPEDSILKTYFPKGTDFVEWIAHTDYYDVYIGEITISNQLIKPMYRIFKVSFSAASDATLNSNILSIIPNIGKAELICNMNSVQALDSSDIIVIELDNKSDAEYSMNVILYDSDGNAISRYLPNLHAGKCIVPMSLPGFVEGDEELIDLNEFNLRFYPENKKEINLEIGNVYKFETTAEYVQYLSNTDYIPIWQ